MLFRSNDTATTEIYTTYDTLSLHDALPIARLRKEREPLSASFLTLVWAPGEAQADDSYRLWAQTETDVMDDILWVADLGFDQESQRFSQELSRDEEGFNAYLAALAERGLLENEYCGV